MSKPQNGGGKRKTFNLPHLSEPIAAASGGGGGGAGNKRGCTSHIGDAICVAAMCRVSRHIANRHAEQQRGSITPEFVFTTSRLIQQYVRAVVDTPPPPPPEIAVGGVSKNPTGSNNSGTDTENPAVSARRRHNRVVRQITTATSDHTVYATIKPRAASFTSNGSGGGGGVIEKDQRQQQSIVGVLRRRL